MITKLLRAIGLQKTQTTQQSDWILPAARGNWQRVDMAQMTPDYVASILRSALSGDSPAQEQALWNLMITTWPRLAKNILDVKNSVAALDWSVMDAHDDCDLRDLIANAQNGMRGNVFEDGLGWSGMLRSLINGYFRGISIVEIDWRSSSDGTAVLPRQVRRVPPSFYGWDSEDGILKLKQDDKLGEFPPNKFIIATHNISDDHPSGGAMLRCLAWWWTAANFSQEWLLNFAQLFGQPLRWATYDPSDKNAKHNLEIMLENMGSNAYGAAPAGTELKLLESSKNGGDNPQTAIINQADKICDLLILGQTLTSDAGNNGSRALGEVQQDTHSGVIDAVGNWLAEILNDQLVPAICNLNRETLDHSRLPWFEPSPKSVKDRKLLAETFKICLECGVEISKEWLHEQLDIPLPQEGESIMPTLSQQLTRATLSAALAKKH